MAAEALRDRLAHVADLHFWEVVWNPLRLLNKRALGNLNVLLRRRRQFPMERAESFVDAVVSAGCPTVLLTGDFSSTSTDAEFAMARAFVDSLRARGLNTPLLPGNHDVYTFEAARTGRFERHFADLLPEGGYPCRQSLPGGTPLILVPTVRPNLLSSRGSVLDETVAAVAELLRDGTGPAIVAGHFPVLDHAPGYHLTRGRRLRNAAALRAVLGQAGRPILYVCGHTHRFSYARDARFAAVSHLCTGALFRVNRAQGLHGEFAEIHVHADRFGVIRHVYTQAWASHALEPAPPEIAPQNVW
ncbi:MAG: metallophosphoesterase [Candidatus Hydrogenedentes bacterium]|nr:metallophosphoesterase [Candidatus Hydrogenedentota bacterium]